MESVIHTSSLANSAGDEVECRNWQNIQREVVHQSRLWIRKALLFLPDAVIVYWWSKSGGNPSREKQTENHRKSNWKLCNVGGRKLRALSTAVLVCFLIHRLGWQDGWPTGWKERDQELRLYCLCSITQFEPSHYTFTTVSFDAVIPISPKQRRPEAFTHQVGFILCPNPRHQFSIPPADWARGVFPYRSQAAESGDSDGTAWTLEVAPWLCLCFNQT